MEELDVFLIFESVTDWTWEQASGWKQFERDTIGKQLVTAMDSINANLVEGDGRYSTQDSIRFFRIARASAREARLWLRRAQKRNLVSPEVADQKIEELTRATKLLNLLIAYRRKAATTQMVKESMATYGAGKSVTAEPDPFLEPEEEA